MGRVHAGESPMDQQPRLAGNEDAEVVGPPMTEPSTINVVTVKSHQNMIFWIQSTHVLAPGELIFARSGQIPRVFLRPVQANADGPLVAPRGEQYV